MRVKLIAALVLSALALVVAPVATAQAAPATAVRSGMKIEVDQSIVTSAVCTLGAVVSAKKAITAGHCGNVGQTVYTDRGVAIGRITANRINRGLDIAVIRLARNTRAQIDVVAWGSGFSKGEWLSKRGVTTGYTTGRVIDPKPTVRSAWGFTFAAPFLLRHTTASIRAQIRSAEGDSGSGVRDSSGRVVGILSAGASSNDTLIAPVSLLPANLR